MEYREKIIELIFDDDENAFTDWVLAHPLILQPDLFRQFREISTELIREAGGEEIPELDAMDKQTDKYEESILDELVAEVKYDMALEERNKHEAEAADKIVRIREYIIDCIVTGADNAEAMKELAYKIIAMEKESGFYDPENWKAIL